MKKIIFILLAAALLSLAGCKSEPACTSEFVPQSGFYMTEKKPGAMTSPYIGINLEDNTFSFGIDPLASYQSYGKIEKLENGYLLKCCTNDDKYTYMFRIISDDTIVYVAQSPTDEIRDYYGVTVVKDGTEFKLKK